MGKDKVKNMVSRMLKRTRTRISCLGRGKGWKRSFLKRGKEQGQKLHVSDVVKEEKVLVSNVEKNMAKITCLGRGKGGKGPCLKGGKEQGQNNMSRMW